MTNIENEEMRILLAKSPPELLIGQNLLRQLPNTDHGSPESDAKGYLLEPSLDHEPILLEISLSFFCNSAVAEMR